MSSYQWPSLGGGGVATYSTLSAFPSASGAGNGALAIALDTNILYESNGTTWLQIAGPGAVLSIGSIDSQTASANGAVIAADQLIMQSASATVPGLMNTTTQTIAGVKTFTSANLITPSIGAATGTSLITTGIIASGTYPISSGHVSAFLNGPAGLLEVYAGGSDAYTYGIGPTDGIAIASVGSGGRLLTLNPTSAVFADAQTGVPYLTSNATVLTTPGTLTASNFSGSSSGTNTGDVTLVTANGLSLSGQALSLGTASTSTTGALTSTDWNTFNGKQAAGSYITSLTGGVTASGPGAATATVVTNANLTGPITSVGNATSIASQTGTGTKFVVDTSPTLITPVIGAATGTSLNLTGSVTAGTQLISSVATGTAPLVVSSTTQVANLNAATAGSAGSVTGTVAVGNGGTGQTTLTNHGVLIGAATSGITQLAAPAVNTVLTGQGASADPSFSSSPILTSVSSATANPAAIGVIRLATTEKLAWRNNANSGNVAVFTDSSDNLVYGSGGGNIIATSGVGVYLTTLTTVNDSGDPTKKLSWGLSGFTTGTTRTVTVPNASFTMVGDTTTQTLTNKTIGVSQLSGQVAIANGGTAASTKAGGFDALSPMTTGGDLIYGGASGTGTRLANGSTGQVLTSAGGTAAPTWSGLPTASYAQAYFGATTSWATTSTTFADGTNTNGNALTVRQSSGITLTAAASNVCGITFTPAVSTAVYLITAQVALGNGITSGVVARMYDGTTVISQGNALSAATAVQFSETLTGIYVPGTGSAVTVKIQIATMGSNNTASIVSAYTSSISTPVEWSVIRIF